MIGQEIHQKLQVERIKLQICQFQTKSDINWKSYHYTRKWMASLESKNTNLKIELKTMVLRKIKLKNKMKPIPKPELLKPPNFTTGQCLIYVI